MEAAAPCTPSLVLPHASGTPPHPVLVMPQAHGDPRGALSPVSILHGTGCREEEQGREDAHGCISSSLLLPPHMCRILHTRAWVLGVSGIAAEHPKPSLCILPLHRTASLMGSLPPAWSDFPSPASSLLGCPGTASLLPPCPWAVLTQPQQEAGPVCWAEIREIRLATKGIVSTPHALPSPARLGQEQLHSPVVTTQ